MPRLAPVIAVLAVFALSLELAAETPVVRLSEPVSVDAGAESFGATVPLTPAPVALAEVLADADQYLGSDIIVSARIGQVCQKKGCFFIARDGDSVVRVTFLDYAFFIPTDAGGKRAVFKGKLKRETVTAAEAEHYAEDLGNGDDNRMQAGPAYSIVAAAIRIEG